MSLSLTRYMALSLAWYVFVFFFDKPDGEPETYVQLTCWAFHSYFAFLYFCLCVFVSLFLSVLVSFDKPDGGTESDVHPTCWVWDEGGVEAALPLCFVIIKYESLKITIRLAVETICPLSQLSLAQ